MGVTFKTIKDLDSSTLMVVDGLNMAFKYLDKEEWTSDYINMVNSLRRSYKAHKVVIASDQGASSFRKSIYPAYKQNRKDKQATQTEEEQAKFEQFFNCWQETLLVLEQEFPVLRFQGVEADDIAAYIVKNISRYNIDKVWLISSDGDWDLLVSDKVSRFSYVTRKERTVENWDEKYTCTPETLVDLKALMGDTGDNIIGVNSVGPKRAQELIHNFGGVFDIIENIPIPGKYKYLQEVNKSKDLLELNMQLVDLLTYCEVAIGEANLPEIDKVFNG